MSSDESTTGDNWRPRDLPRTVLRPLLSTSGADTNCLSRTPPVDNDGDTYDDSSIDNSSSSRDDSNLDEDSILIQSHPFLSRATKHHQRDFSRTIRLSTSGSTDHGMLSTITRAYTQLTEGLNIYINVKTIHVMIFMVGVSLVMKIASLAPSPIQHADVASSMGTIGAIGYADGLGLRGAVMPMLDEGEFVQVQVQGDGDGGSSEPTLQTRYYRAQQQPGQSSPSQQAYLGAQPNSGYAVGHLSTYDQSPVELQQQQGQQGQQGQMTQQVVKQQTQFGPAIDPYQLATQQQEQLAVPLLESVMINDDVATADSKVADEAVVISAMTNAAASIADEIITATTLQTTDVKENDIPTVQDSSALPLLVPGESVPSSQPQRLGLLNRGYSLLAPSGSED